jgi:uncharacterized Tic20 family protein
MPHSETDDDTTPGEGLATIAEVLYLTNLLLLPGIAFGILVWLWWTRRADAPALAAAHLNQTVSASLWGGVLLVIVNGLILLLGGYQGINTWVILILYFTTAHATLVLLGVLGLSKAMAGQCWRFPLIGRPLPPNCPDRGPT